LSEENFKENREKFTVSKKYLPLKLKIEKP